MAAYEPKKIEEKWNKKWLDEKVFKANDDSAKPKYYQLETFPYPSAAGLHIGHPKGYIAEDIHARYMRMQGKEVLYTMGWDAFGLPTENYAIKMGKPPKEIALANTDNFRRQVQMFGFSYDWDREINSSSPEYYKWTQWLFIQLYKKGLAYRAEAKVNWCPKDQTVLANEQVIDGKCERCGSEIEERMMEQWFVKITDYAEKLLSGLEGLDWPSATIKRQQDWIGKSEGAELSFLLDFKKNPTDNDNRGPNGERAALKVFTTRPDTLFGATYLVLAPEHPWVTLAIDDQHDVLLNKDEVKAYVEATFHKTELMRKTDEKEKSGVELKGVKAINPANQEEMSIWIADYVLGSYGTGAIMAVPAHDIRDLDFAEKFKLPIKHVIEPLTFGEVENKFLYFSKFAHEENVQNGLKFDYEKINSGQEVMMAYIGGEGKLINSGKFNGMDSEKAKTEIVALVGGIKKTQYRLRDWSISRQRYWGCPIPMIHCKTCGIVPVPENQLPVILPDLEDYRPQGMPPLASSPEFMNVKCPQCGGDAKRDPETLDTFVDSSWYYLRYPDPHNVSEIFNKEKAQHWLPVDLYVIGAEHTVLHLLYSRFITKFLYDEGYVTFAEPFTRLKHQGLIMGTDGAKMSKSKGNVVNPDEIVAEFSADATRLYLMFMGPFNDSTPWDAKGILGIERFLKRFWNYSTGVIEKTLPPQNPEKPSAVNALHRTIKRVGEDIESFKFNTAISALMILLNELETSQPLDGAQLGLFIKLLHPLAPHMAQELWSLLDNESYLDFEPWPKYDPALIVEDTVTLVFQVNGKIRDTVTADVTIEESGAKEMALQNPKVQAVLGGQTPKRIIYVDKKLVNIVI